jgi:hypothetical protein
MELLWAAAARAKLGELNDAWPPQADLVLGDFKETNPVLRTALNVFRGNAKVGDLEIHVIESSKSGYTHDPLGRGFLGHFFGGLYFDSVRGNQKAAALHFAAASLLPFTAGDGMLEALAASFAGVGSSPGAIELLSWE